MEEKKEVTHSLHLEKRGHGLITGVTIHRGEKKKRKEAC